MPQRRQQPQYQQIAPQEAFLGDYSALAQQFLRKKDKPIYSVGQGLVEAGSDIAEAFLMKDAAKREQRKEEMTNEALAKAFENTSNTSLGIYPEFAGQSPAMSANQRGRYASSRLAEADPNAAAAMTPSLMQMAQQFEPPKDTYQVNDQFGVMRTPANGGAPEVVMPVPARPRESKLLTPEEEAQQLRIEAAKRPPAAPKEPKTPVQLYEERYGKIEPGMSPEIANGVLTGRQIPAAGASKDPATIETARVKDLELSLPKASAALQSSLGEFDKTITAIDEVLSPDNAEGLGDVTGFGGTSIGKMLTPAGGDAARVQARLDQIRGRTFIAGMNALKAASPTGATGLGAASEREGENVIQAQAALNQAQSDEDYAKALREYKAALVQAKNTIASTFQQEYAPVLKTVLPPSEQAGFAGRGASGSWGDGETKVIAGARVTRLGN